MHNVSQVSKSKLEKYQIFEPEKKKRIQVSAPQKLYWQQAQLLNKDTLALSPLCYLLSVSAAEVVSAHSRPAFKWTPLSRF